MTYDRRASAFHCDTCPEAIETGETDFDAAREATKRAGWKTYKGPDKQWAHACPACAEDYAKEQRNVR